MDLLGGYGSGSDEDSGSHGHAPAPSRGPSQQVRPAGPARPPRNAQEDEDDAPGPSSSGGAILSKLPTPKVQAKKVIAFQLPLNRSMLDAADSDDEETAVRAAKRLKASTGPRSKLMDYLPAPKNDSVLGAGLGGGSMAGPKAPGKGRPPRDFFGDEEGEDPVLAAGKGDGGAAAVGLGNEAYRADDAPPQWPEQAHGAYQYSAEQYAGYQQYEEHQQYYPADAAGPSGSGMAQHAAQAKAKVAADAFEIPELAGVQFKEINQQELRYVDPARKEAAKSLGSVLGAEFADKIRSQAKSHAGTKLARSKHQIGTLFFNAKMNEIDILEGKANSMKTKAETQAKYGW